MKSTERQTERPKLLGIREPWSWLDPQSTQGSTRLNPAYGPALLAPVDAPPYLPSGQCELPPRGPAFPTASGSVLRAYDLPQAERGAISHYRPRSQRETIQLEIVNQCPKPGYVGEDEAADSEELEKLVDSMVGIMLELRSVTEYVAGLSDTRAESLSDAEIRSAEHEFSSTSTSLLRMNWEDVPKCLFSATDEPQMDLIVRIARQYERELRELAGDPRHVLRTERRKQSLGRVQEIDSTCLRWLVRQPGRTPTQKAGPQQKILAVTRTQDYDTLENRVLKDFLVRGKRAAELYVGKNESRYADSYRYRLVGRFRDMCGWLLRQPALEEVQSLRRVPQPNYALQHDRSYRRLWNWYLKLVRRERQNDEAWRWQGRLWSDISRLLASASLLNLDTSGYRTRTAFRHDLWVREEQDDGRWLLPIDWPGPIILRAPDDCAVIVQCYHPGVLEQGDCYQDLPVSEWMGQTGADFAVIFSPFAEDPGRHVCVFVWGIHGGVQNPREHSGAKQCNRACRALHQLRNNTESRDVIPKGLIFKSLSSGQTRDLPKAGFPGGPEVLGFSVPCDPLEWNSESGILDVLSVFWCECAQLARGQK